MSAQVARLDCVVDKLDLACGALKNVIDGALGCCAVCTQSSVASIHNVDNSFTHRFVRCEMPVDGL